MIDRILHRTEVESATFRLTCGTKAGSTFAVRNTGTELLFLTSFHNLQPPSESPIFIEISDSEKLEAEILEAIEPHDIAILKTLNTPVNPTILPLSHAQIANGESWESYGYIAERIVAGSWVNGKVASVKKWKRRWDLDLGCEQLKNYKKLDGLSGSPLIINGLVLGVIGYDITGGLGATSLRSVAEILENHGIVLKQNPGSSIPQSMEEEILNLKPNSSVIKKIEETVQMRNATEYFLVRGNPGSGKTTISAQLKFKDENLEILDKYFVKVDDDLVPTQVRANPENFIIWINEVCYKILYGTPSPIENMASSKGSQKGPNSVERFQKIRDLLYRVSENCRKEGKTGFITIDGLDDVSPSSIDDFLSVLVPDSRRTHLKFIFSCTSKLILPLEFQNSISKDDEIEVEPLEIGLVEDFLNERFGHLGLKPNQIRLLAEKSEGYPLYLRYLEKYVLGIENIDTFDEWVHSMPTIGGVIETYYTKIWMQMASEDEKWLAATLSRIRQPIQEKELYELLPQEAKKYFNPALAKIRHLLRANSTLSIYHSSFSDFVKKKTGLQGFDIHDIIASYCLSEPKSYFKIVEKIYHLTQGSEQSRREALSQCNQEWADECLRLGVVPEHILEDGKQALGTALDLGIFNKSIEFLLLSQRINFRYNNLFIDNAFPLALALISQGKFDEALRYVIRNKELILGDDEVLWILQILYEQGAIEQANYLHSVIKIKCNEIVEKGLTSETFRRFIHLRFRSLAISSYDDPKETHEEFVYLKRAAIRLMEGNGNSEESIHRFKDQVGVYIYAFMIFYHDFLPISHLLEKEGKFKFDDKYSGFQALSICQVLDIEKVSFTRANFKCLSSWCKDLERMIDAYGFNIDYGHPLLIVLIRFSNRNDIIKSVFESYFQSGFKLSLRMQNGVDINRSSVSNFQIYAACCGLLDSNNSIPPYSQIRSGNWESKIEKNIYCFFFLVGRVRKLLIEDPDNQLSALKNELIKVYDCLLPDLRERIHWPRSYSLPEQIIPMILAEAIDAIASLCSEYLEPIVKDIESQKNYQLGLYTEGYISVLFHFGERLSKEEKFNTLTFKILKRLESHVISTVENRWERNTHLLRLVELYARIDSTERANQVFEEMIRTSMGPSWYKEAQLGIINTSVSNLASQSVGQKYLRMFASHLDCASREMTFQRYIKQEQENFAGDLAKIGWLEKSIEYFKFLVFPDYSTVIQNAEMGKVDMPILGEGYSLGAREIEEQAGVLSILTDTDCEGSLVAWALTELLLLGDDRYIYGFVKVQSKILNHAKDADSPHFELLTDRLARFFSAELDGEFRQDYVNELTQELRKDVFVNVKTKLELDGFKIPSQTKDEKEKWREEIRDDNPLNILVGKKEKVEEALSLENRGKARGLIIESLEEIQKKKYGIWSSNYSNKIDELRDVLPETISSLPDQLNEIKGLILNEPYSEGWIIADKLIELFGRKCSSQEQEQILEVVNDHLHYMIRTPEDFMERYNWLPVPTGGANRDEILIKFLIWFLNHPSLILKNRTMELLAWLGISIPKITIPALIKEINRDGYQISKELSAAVLHQISAKDAESFWDIFKGCLENQEIDPSNIQHFMIRNAIYEALENSVNAGGEQVQGYLDIIQKSFPSKSSSGNVAYEEDYLNNFEDYIYEFDELGIWTKNVHLKFLDSVQSNSPLSIEDSQKANAYLERSFNNHNEIKLINDFDNILRCSLNHSIVDNVTFVNRSRVASILRFYQPTFPENDLRRKPADSKETLDFIQNLVENQVLEIPSSLCGDEVCVDFYFKRNPEIERWPETFEISAFLIENEHFNRGRFSFPSSDFASNNFPSKVKIGRSEKVIPIIQRASSSAEICGSDLVPSFISPEFESLLANTDESTFKRLYWRNGRNWKQSRQGICQESGYHLSIPSSNFRKLESSYKLVWYVRLGLKNKVIDVFKSAIV